MKVNPNTKEVVLSEKEYALLREPIEQIKAEVVRRIKEREESYVDDNTLELKNQEDFDIIEILDTLQEKSEKPQPVSEDVEKELVRFVSGYLDAGVSAKDYVKAFSQRLLDSLGR